MVEFFYRTEDIPVSDILTFFVHTDHDRKTVDQLKGTGPVLLEGSRGTGKSFLLRVAEQELRNAFSETRVLPVYLTFLRSSLIRTKDDKQFHHWMLARLCSKLLRSLEKIGVATKKNSPLSIHPQWNNTENINKLESLIHNYENSYKNPGQKPDVSSLPSVDQFKDFVEDACQAWNIKRIVVLFDEAAHVFRPEQQRQFFTLFRDLRAPVLNCKAAVYPGTTSYGDTFERTHDATTIRINRDLHADNYVFTMREMVDRQANESLKKAITNQEKNFALLAYASSGNPRLLLKSVGTVPKMGSRDVSKHIKEFYRTDIWSEHSGISSTHSGHSQLVDWGRQFLEETVLPEMKRRNDSSSIRNGSDKARRETTCYFWLDRDAPQLAKEALRLLAYTGIVVEDAQNFKATRGKLGTRFAVNAGSLLALEANPAKDGLEICQALTKRRFNEYSAAHSTMSTFINMAIPDLTLIEELAFRNKLNQPVSVLDLTNWQKKKLPTIDINTVKQLLNASEQDLQKIRYVGEIRSRRILNQAVAAISVLEFLSG